MLTDVLLPRLESSRATPAFRADVETYARTGMAPRVVTARHSPPVKVLRVLAQLLEAEPDLPIDRVEITGRSGCSDFSGVITVHTAEAEPRTFDFTWCCAWRAQQEGWIDGWGLPDQMRAAQVFGWDCFERWHERKLATT